MYYVTVAVSLDAFAGVIGFSLEQKFILKHLKMLINRQKFQ